RLLQPFHLVEARVGPHTHFLHEVLGVDFGPRQPIGRAIQHLVVLPDQRRKSLLLRRTARVDGWLSHAVTVLCPSGPKLPTRMTSVLVPRRALRLRRVYWQSRIMSTGWNSVYR